MGTLLNMYQQIRIWSEGLEMGQDNRCTFFFNGNWLECCRAHDYDCADAEAMQSRAMRMKADADLKKCVTGKGHPIIAWIMFMGCRLWVCIKGGYRAQQRIKSK